MRAISPPDSVHAKDGTALAAPDVRFFSVREGEALVAVGAFQPVGAGHAEIKSMHTVAERRGEGIAETLLLHLLETARAEGFARVSLETGSTGHFAAARRLYARHGFRPCGPFAGYRADPHSAFMTRSLAE